MVVALAGAVLTVPTAAQQDLTFALFERYLEALRQQAGIPGLSGAIVRDRTIVWERGLGLQSIDRSVAATPDTPYPIGHLTQTVGATLALQCVERGQVSLADSIQRWTNAISEAETTIGQVLSHAAPAPAEGFRFAPARFAALTAVLADCAGKPFPKLVAEAVLDRLAMIDSIPGLDLGEPGADAEELFDVSHLHRYASIRTRVAAPYKVDRSGRPTRSEYPSRGLNAATGLVSTVRDLARFDAALDDGVLLRPETLAMAWTNATASSSGSPLPFGLGWFVQPYNGERIVWHFGLLRDSFSSLIVKIPRRNLTLILLANSDGLSGLFPLANGDVTASVFAQLFLRTFVP